MQRSTFTGLLVAAGIVAGMPAHGQVVRQITHNATDVHVAAAIDDTGNRVAMISSADPVGTNPSHTLQVFGHDLAADTTHRITSFPAGVGGRGTVASSVAISDDGETIAFVSAADPTGENPDGSLEIFTIGFDGTGVTQVTSIPSPGLGTIWSLRLAGSGSHIVFLAAVDPLGSNPAFARQLFKVEADGSNLQQLTTAPLATADHRFAFRGYSVSDDGSVVVFSHNARLTTDNTPTTPRIWVAEDGQPLQDFAGFGGTLSEISGDGTRVVFVDVFEIVTALLADPSGATVVADEGADPTITDDGAWIYFAGLDGGPVFRVEVGGTDPPEALQAGVRPIVSGNGNRVVAPRAEPLLAEGLAGTGARWYAFDADGTDPVALTDVENDWRIWQPSTGAAGERLVVNAGPPVSLGTPTTGENDVVYSLREDGTDLAQLTPIGAPSRAIIGPDESFAIVKPDVKYTDPPDPGSIFYRADIDGTGLTQLSEDYDGINVLQAVARDNDTVLFISTITSFAQLYTASTAGWAEQQISFGSEPAYTGRFDGAGQWVVFSSATNHDGQNPGEQQHPQILRVRIDGSGEERITLGPHISWMPDVSGDGDHIVYVSNADPHGTNGDGNPELFLFRPSTGVASQLTFTTGGQQSSPDLTHDAEWVYFLSTSPMFEPRTTDLYELYRLRLSSGELERVGGLFDPRGGIEFVWPFRNYSYTVADDGDVFFTGSLDATGENPDLSWEVWHVDYAAVPRLSIGAGGSATTVAWEPDPTAVRYDLVRGNLAQLGAGPGGSVDLGTVVCLGDGVIRPRDGVVDPDQPGPGSGFFYVYRGSQGIFDGPGSYGEGTDGARAAGAGDCPADN